MNGKSFHGYLRCEVDSAGKHYEEAREKVLRLTGGPETHSGPALLEAVEVLAESTRLYLGALRRMAHYAAHQAQIVDPKAAVRHA